MEGVSKGCEQLIEGFVFAVENLGMGPEAQNCHDSPEYSENRLTREYSRNALPEDSKGSTGFFGERLCTVNM